MTRTLRLCVLTAVLIGTAAVASAQNPPVPPPPPWTASLAAGLALTGGNTSTTTTNLAFTVESDKTKRNVIKAEGLNLRSSRDGDAIVDRTSLQAQDNYSLTTRTYVFGRMQYLRDVFKSIDYLISPTGGVGYKVIDTMATSLVGEVAAGAVTEKNPGLERKTSGALTAGEKATHKISPAASLTESLTALWKTSDFGDSLVTFQAGLATDITPRTQLKVDFLDTYKSKPTSVLVKKNDTALIMSFVFKF
jgi:putative salt-induced outer membrane protein YdiY